MKTGLFATFMSPIATPDMITTFAQRVEQEGVDALWLGEHVVLFDEMEFPYPGSKDGKIPVPEGGGMLDTVAEIGFMASCTSTLRFGTGITLLPQRNPIYTAKEFVTLDWLSKGRIDFGVGVGWCKEEVIACGYTWEDRGKRCDEFLALLRKLWTEEYPSFSGEHFELAECRMDPKPVQKPHIPIIMGGNSKAAMRRTAEFADGWYGFNMDPAYTAKASQDIDDAFARIGRKRDSDFRLVITPPYKITTDEVKQYRDLGVDELVLHLGNQKPERINQRLAEIEPLIAAAR